MYKILRNFLFLLDAEKSHNLALKILYYLDKIYLLNLFNKIYFHNKANNSKIGLAAGLDKNADYISALSKLGFGFIEVGTVTPRPQPGNPKPRLFRVTKHDAIINRMGFNNQGIDYLISNIKEFKNNNKSYIDKTNFKIGINIGKNFDTPIEQAVNDYLICLEKAYNYSDYIIVNISSPNTLNLRKLQSEEYLDDLLNQLKLKQLELADKYNKYIPLGIKIAPDLTHDELNNICSLIIKYKIDIIIATNTTIDISEEILQEYNKIINNSNSNLTIGGLSGRPIYNKSSDILNYIVNYFNSNNYKNKIKIISAGGIFSKDNANYRLKIGADAIQIYTGFIYRGPQLIKEINQV